MPAMTEGMLLMIQQQDNEAVCFEVAELILQNVPHSFVFYSRAQRGYPKSALRAELAHKAGFKLSLKFKESVYMSVITRELFPEGDLEGICREIPPIYEDFGFCIKEWFGFSPAVHQRKY